MKYTIKLQLIITQIFIIALCSSQSTLQAQWSNPDSLGSIFYNNGNIGIGTDTPLTQIHLMANPSRPQIRLEDRLGAWDIWGGSDLVFQKDSISRLVIRKDGKVGVGLTNPQTSFDVKSTNFTVARMYRPGGNGAAIKFQNDQGNVVIGIGAREEIYFGQSNSTFMAFAKTGRLGIGTFDPKQNLSIKSTRPRIALSDMAGDAGVIEFHEGTNQLRLQFWKRDGSTFQKNMMVLDGNKDGVGIGTTNVPIGYKLAVDGKVVCEEIFVSMSQDWPDYVFADDYQLKSIEEVEQFIEQENHLPGIPAAAKVENEGLEVGEMQRKMMEKIEELTLYVIELNKKVKNQDELIQQLQQQ